MMRAFLLILTLAMTVSAQVPIGEKAYDLGGGKRSVRLGGTFENYDSSGVWKPINTSLHVNGNGYIVNWTNLLKTTIDSSGVVMVTYTHNGNDYTVTQELKSLKLFRRADSAMFNIDATPNWSNISMDSNVVRWTNVFPGVDYTLTIGRGQVLSAVHYKPAFLDSLTVLLAGRPDSNDIYLANISSYTLSANIDNRNVHLGNVRKRAFKRWGKRVFGLDEQVLQYPGAELAEDIPVWQRHAMIGGNLFVGEFVKALSVRDIHEANPTAEIWHNSSTSITDNEWQITNIKKYSSTTNFSTGTTTDIANSESPENTNVALYLPDLSVIRSGSTIDSVAFANPAYWADTLYEYELVEITTEWSEASPNCWDSAMTGATWSGGSWSYANDLGSNADSLERGRAKENATGYCYSADGEGLCETFQNTLDGTAYGFAMYLRYGSSVTGQWYTEDAASANRPTADVIYTLPSCTSPDSLAADSVGTNNQWTNTGGASDKWTAVNDNSDATYISGAIAGYTQDFTFEADNCITSSVTVDTVIITCRIQESSSATNTLTICTYDGSAVDTIRQQDPTTSWVDYVDTLTTAPDGGAWDSTAIANLQLRFIATTVVFPSKLDVAEIDVSIIYHTATVTAYRGQIIAIKGD